MPKKIFIVTGLGWGDECKGSITHYLAWKYGAHTVVRTGGAQALHRVVTSKGEDHVHKQFGSGSLVRSGTHLSRHMVIEPDKILNEGDALKYQYGISGIFDSLTIDEEALVITPYHGIANRIRELARGANRHGSVGIGVGEVVLDSEIPDHVVIRAKDLSNLNLAEKIEALRVQKIRDLQEVMKQIEEIGKLDQDTYRTACQELRRLYEKDFVQIIAERFTMLAERARIVGTEYLAEKILKSPGTVIFEGSQGVLLDRFYGFHPHTTQVRTIPDTALSLIREANYDGGIKNIGVLRAYHTRHGAGPFVTESEEMTKALPDIANGPSPWQGNFRVGHFDMLMAKYAIRACGGPTSLDGIALTCVDRVSHYWRICESYDGPYKTDFFSYGHDGVISEIKVKHNVGDEHLKRQEKLGNLLRRCKPNLITLGTPFCCGNLKERMGVPVVIKSSGSTELDKEDILK